MGPQESILPLNTLDNLDVFMLQDQTAHRAHSMQSVCDICHEKKTRRGCSHGTSTVTGTFGCSRAAPPRRHGFEEGGGSSTTPEEFRHAGQVSMPSSPSTATAAIATGPQEQVSGSPDSQVVSRDEDVETLQMQQEHPLEGTSLFSNADDGPGVSFAKEGGSANAAVRPTSSPGQRCRSRNWRARAP